MNRLLILSMLKTALRIPGVPLEWVRKFSRVLTIRLTESGDVRVTEDGNIRV